MSEYKDKNNTGKLFRNFRKEKQSQPDYKGKIKCHETLFWVSGWINESAGGQKYMNLKLEEVDGEKTAKELYEPKKNDLPF